MTKFSELPTGAIFIVEGNRYVKLNESYKIFRGNPPVMEIVNAVSFDDSKLYSFSDTAEVKRINVV